MTGQVIAIYGASGFGREVLPIVREQTVRDRPSIVFIDDEAGSTEDVNGYMVYNWHDFSKTINRQNLAITIANATIRSFLQERCQQNGIRMFEVRSPNIFIGDHAIIAEVAIIQPFVTLPSNIVIGRCFHANIDS